MVLNTSGQQHGMVRCLQSVFFCRTGLQFENALIPVLHRVPEGQIVPDLSCDQEIGSNVSFRVLTDFSCQIWIIQQLPHPESRSLDGVNQESRDAMRDL